MELLQLAYRQGTHETVMFYEESCIGDLHGVEMVVLGLVLNLYQHNYNNILTCKLLLTLINNLFNTYR